VAIKIWKDILGKNGIDIGPDKIIEKIINELFIIDKIDPKVFLSNYSFLLTGGMGNTLDLFGVQHNQLSEPSASIREFDSPIERAKAFPLWFIAAYPDVMLWFQKWQRNFLKLHNRDYNLLAFESAKLFGINTQNENINEENIIDKDGKYLPGCLKELVMSHKTKVGDNLETKVKKIEDDIYLSEKLLKMFGVEDNFTFIASNIIKYYLELKNNYLERFVNEVPLLTAAGVLDALVYLQNKETTVEKIRNIAIDSVGLYPENEDEYLLEFILKMEVMLFSIDTELAISNIENACYSKKEYLQELISNIKKEYIGESIFREQVNHFILSGELENLRQEIGILRTEGIKSTDAKTEELSKNICPACSNGKLVPTYFPNGNLKELKCNICNSTFKKTKDNKYKYIFIGNTENPFWRKYNFNAFSILEWNNLSKNSNEDILKWEAEQKNIKMRDTYNEALGEVHPWRRYWARIFDLTFSFPIYLIILLLFSPNMYLYLLQGSGEYISGLILLFFYMIFFEPMLISAFGSTPGKALLGIKIRDLSGNKISYSTAMKRGFYVLINGLGIGLPIITIFTMITAYNRLKRNGKTSWDEACGTKVLHSKISILRVILFIIIFVICMIISRALYGGI